MKKREEHIHTEIEHTEKKRKTEKCFFLLHFSRSFFSFFLYIFASFLLKQGSIGSDEIDVMTDICDDDAFKKTTRQVGRQGAVRGKKIYEERGHQVLFLNF